MRSSVPSQVPIRVLVADDGTGLRGALRRTARGGAVELVGEAADDAEALRLAGGIRPEAIVLGLGLPGHGGLEILGELHRRVPGAAIVAISPAAGDLRREALERGALACLDADVDAETLLAAVRAACARPARPAPGPAADPPDGELERLWGSLAHAPLATALAGPDGRFLRVNDALCELVGHQPATLLANGLAAVVHPEDREADREQLDRLLAGETGAYQLRQRCRRADGEAIAVLCNTWLAGPARPGAARRPGLVVRQLVDLREGTRPEDRLAWRVTHDPLTGLPNRSLFLDRLEMTVARQDREPGLAAVLALDLDRLGLVAERHGEDATDRLLVAFAGRLRSIFRRSDTVARFGSDEFAVLCSALRRERDAVLLAERIVTSLATPFAVDGRDVAVSASIGVALSYPRPRRPESLLTDADVALRRAKRRGGGAYELFDEAVSARLAERLASERALRCAIRAGELGVAYQPIVSLADGRPVGVEALARWPRPGGRELQPAELAALTEESGLIVPLGAWLLEEACRQAAAWPPGAAGAAVHVDLSPRQFAEPHLVDVVAEALAAGRAEPGRLCLEVTEAALAANPAAAATACGRLADLGVRLAVDGFGAGYSSLAALRALPLSALKVGPSCVARLGVDADADAVVAAAVGVAHTLGLSVIADGVETPRQHARLRALGCDAAQGAFVAHPFPAARIAELAARARRWW